MVIPKALREALGVKEGHLLKVYIRDGRIVLEPVGSVADRYYGIVRVSKWPDDLDEFLHEAMRKWWRV